VSSPVLLMHSGIGPKDHLEELGIPVVHDSVGVGAALTDHLHVPISYRVEGGLEPHSHSNICEGSLFTRLNPESAVPDLQVHCGTIFFHPSGFVPEGEGYTLTPSLIHPRSRGTIRLRSGDPEEKPIISPCYLTDPEGYDMQILMDGVRLTRKLGQRMVEKLGGYEEYPGPAVQSDDDIATYVRRYVGTMYHPTSTCRMGPDGDSSAVLDPQLRVRGIKGVRVVDASVMPEIVGANTNATCVALGEKGATFLVEEYQETYGKGTFGKSQDRAGQSNQVGTD